MKFEKWLQMFSFFPPSVKEKVNQHANKGGKST
jgi:hypothetical protein